MIKFESQYGLQYEKGPKISEKAQNYGKRPKLCKGPKVIDPGPKKNKKGPKMSVLGPKGPKTATVLLIEFVIVIVVSETETGNMGNL